MIKETRKTMIGGFVIGALTLVITAILVFGSGDFFRKKDRYVLYFNDSVKGLSVGAPVLFQGVQIGTVITISLVANADEMSIRIPVVIESDPGKWEFEHDKKLGHESGVSKLIEKGLRASMKMQSLVTGKYLIEFGFHPDEPAHFFGTNLPYKELPTIQSGMDKFTEVIANLPLEELVQKLTSAISGLDNLINSEEAKQLVPAVHQVALDAQRFIQSLDDHAQPLLMEISTAVNEYKKLAENVDKHVGPLASDYRKLAQDLQHQIDPLVTEIILTSQAARAGAKMAELTLKSAKELMSNDSPVFMELTKTLKEFSATARSIRIWADYLDGLKAGVSDQATLRNVGKMKMKTTAKRHSKRPAIPRESAVPIPSARAPKGTALNGIIPKLIMAMLTTRPRIS